MVDCLTDCQFERSCCKKFGVTLNTKEAEFFRGKTKVVPLTENGLVLGYVVVLLKKDDACIFYKDQLCTIYEDRPQACRNFDCLTRMS